MCDQYILCQVLKQILPSDKAKKKEEDKETKVNLYEIIIFNKETGVKISNHYLWNKSENIKSLSLSSFEKFKH